MVLKRLRAGFAVIGDFQHFPGYCVLISDDPQAKSLTDLPPARQEEFLADAALLARAVEKVMREQDPLYRRINLEIQGNTDGFLHAHVTPRYNWEPEALVRWPFAVTWWEGISEEDKHPVGSEHKELREKLTAAIERELSAKEKQIRK